MRKMAVVLALCICSALLYRVFWTSASDIAFNTSEAFEKGVCSKDAVLLDEDVVVTFERTETPSSKLEAGRPIYLCETSHDIQRIVFPQEGTPADCSDRASTIQCLTGFISLPVETTILG